jgi:hypothetical protein
VGIKTSPPTFVDVPVGPVGSPDAPPRLPARPGAVLAQMPEAGSRVDQNSLVRLTVAQ